MQDFTQVNVNLTENGSSSK